MDVIAFNSATNPDIESPALSCTVDRVCTLAFVHEIFTKSVESTYYPALASTACYLLPNKSHVQTPQMRGIGTCIALAGSCISLIRVVSLCTW
jgi:hypothetical protein